MAARPRKWHEWRPEKRMRHFLGITAGLLFICVDALAIWPYSHLLGVLWAWVTIGVVLLAEFELKTSLISMVCVTVVSVGVYERVPPESGAPSSLIISPEVEVTGSLQPGNDPPKGNICGYIGRLAVLVGNNGFASGGLRKFTPLRVGTCDVVSMEQTDSGIVANADLYDASGRLIARVVKNKIHALTGNGIRLSREGDLSTLRVVDKLGQELLYVRYMNPTTIRVRGIFGCPGHAPVRIQDNEPIAGIEMNNVCFVNFGRPISIQ